MTGTFKGIEGVPPGFWRRLRTWVYKSLNTLTGRRRFFAVVGWTVEIFKTAAELDKTRTWALLHGSAIGHTWIFDVWFKRWWL